MAFTALDVKKLREMTDCGMMDCKKALTEADGDMDKALEILREKGLAAAQKKASRIAAEGMAYADVINGVGVAVEVNAETDFVAKNEKFVNFVKNIAAVVAETNPADMDDLMTKAYPGTTLTVAEQRQEMVLTIGENINIRRFGRYADGFNVPYVHAGGKIGVVVNLEVSGIDNAGAVTELGKDIAMQIAAMRPVYLDKSAMPAEAVAYEKNILIAQLKEDPKNASKPDAIIEKMIGGRLNKLFEETCLLQQPFVKGDKISVEKHIAAVAKELGGTIVLKSYTRFEKGEGIEKKQSDFAAEIASMVK